jgi:hypothetical protein
MNSRSAGCVVLFLSVLAVCLGDGETISAQSSADTGSAQLPADGSAATAAKPAEAAPRLIDRINPFRSDRFFGRAKSPAPQVMNVDLGPSAPVSELTAGTVVARTATATATMNVEVGERFSGPSLLNQIPLVPVDSRTTALVDDGPQSDIVPNRLTAPPSSALDGSMNAGFVTRASADVVLSASAPRWIDGFTSFDATQDSRVGGALTGRSVVSDALPRSGVVDAALPRR